MIEIRKLTKKYGTFTAIRDIDIKVRAGEIFGFLGPNGAGKTTTIRIMAGLLQPTAGTVLIDGYDIQTHPVEAKAITGFIPDRPFLYEKMTGQEFLRFVCSLYGVNTEDVDKKIQRLLRVFEMENWKDELVESYSHGMRQRIVMSAALIHEPKAIIIDEPMVGLDPKGARLVKEIFKEQAQDRGVSIFMSTHTLEIAEEVCDRIAIIQEGRVIAEGTASDLKKRAGGGSYERLEAAFLRLTGGEDVRDIIEVLGH
jgi:ABC-2 type transport system ATP-binding protein